MDSQKYRSAMQSVDAVYSQNAPIDYQMNDKAKIEYDLLQDILNLLQCLLLKAEALW